MNIFKGRVNNHGMLTRKELRAFIAEKGLAPERVRVPEDGERYHF